MFVVPTFLLLMLPGADVPDQAVRKGETERLPTLAEMQQVVRQSLPFLEREGVAWIKEQKCVSCHQVPFMLWGFHMATSRGFALERGVGEWQRWSLTETLREGDGPKRKEFALKNADTMAQLILGRDYGGLGEVSYQKLGELLLDGQQEDGSWKAGGQLPSQKRPERETDEVSTMWALVALAALEPSERSPERFAQARDRALGWLDGAAPGKSTEWLVVRMLVAKEFGDLHKAASWRALLLREQNADGGWGWLRDGKSDALATGQVLWALTQAGITWENVAVRRAWRHLRDTQKADGSWDVPSTKTVRKDEPRPTSIYWGTGWAAVGLARSLPK